jgi:hypothetical protein
MPSEQSLTARLDKLRYLEQKYRARKIAIQPIANAVIEAGFTSLDAQAKALGISRSTAWTIMKAKHKLGRLNCKTAQCILTNANTPVSVRQLVQTMLDDRNC